MAHPQPSGFPSADRSVADELLFRILGAIYRESFEVAFDAVAALAKELIGSDQVDLDQGTKAVG